MDTPSEIPGRRRFLGGVIAAIQAAIGGTLAFVLGGAILSPGLTRREERWLPAGTLSDLPQNEPKPVTIRVARQDGYTQVIDRRTVFLVKTGDSQVTALDSTCTHLGCRVSWDRRVEGAEVPLSRRRVRRHRRREGRAAAGAAGVRSTTRIDGDQVLVQV